MPAASACAPPPRASARSAPCSLPPPAAPPCWSAAATRSSIRAANAICRRSSWKMCSSRRWMRCPCAPRRAACPHRALETFLQCPFRYLALRLMRLKTAPLRPEERLSFLEQGIIVHEVLAEWWKQPRDVEPLFEQIFACHLKAGHIPNGYHTERLRNAMLDDLKRFTSLDAWPRGAWKSQTEVEFAFPLAEGLEIFGRIDRLDVAPDGRAFVLDYKYSAAQRVKDKVKNENLMQAPLYMMAAEHLNFRPAGMFYVGVKGGVEYAGWSDAP